MPRLSVEQAVIDIKIGKQVIIIDDEDRENEGDLAMAAEHVTPDDITFMATYGRGLICVPMTSEKLERLNLPLMVQNNTATLSTAFTISVDVIDGATTGISSFDRAGTVRALIDPTTQPGDLARPGHIFPLKYQEGGVLVRAGQTEAVVDLAKLAGLSPAGVICEIVSDDGTMARRPALEIFSEDHGIGMVTVADIIAYRRGHEKIVERVAKARIPTKYGEMSAVSYRSLVDDDEHVALVKGEINIDDPVLVRVHSECLTGDVFGSLRCDCGEQLQLSMQLLGKHDSAGIFLYMRQEGRGIGIHNKLKAYNLQDQGMDTVDANKELGFAPDLRHYGVGAQILVDLGVRKIRLLTNNPKKIVGLESFGLEIIERVPILSDPNDENKDYLETKRDRLGHLLE